MDLEIYRGIYDSPLNVFHGRTGVEMGEIRLKHKLIPHPGTLSIRKHYYAEPNEEGSYAFGGTFLFTSNGVFPQFNSPVPLHDRDMTLEAQREDL